MPHYVRCISNVVFFQKVSNVVVLLGKNAFQGLFGLGATLVEHNGCFVLWKLVVDSSSGGLHVGFINRIPELSCPILQSRVTNVYTCLIYTW